MTTRYAAAGTVQDTFSPIMIDGVLVLPKVSVGMIEASATRRPCKAPPPAAWPADNPKSRTGRSFGCQLFWRRQG
jgi:hypothetical protein